MVKKKPRYKKPSSKATSKTKNSNKNSRDKLSWKQFIISFTEKLLIPFAEKAFPSIASGLFIVLIEYLVLVPRLENRIPSELDQVKIKIEEVVPKLGFEIVIADTVMERKHPDLIIMCELKQNVEKLLLYKEVHEISDFRGTTIDERLILAKENLSKRNLYDVFALDIIYEINNLYQYEYSQNSEVDFISILDFKKTMIENMVFTWVNEDTIKNNKLIEQIDISLNLSDDEKYNIMKEVTDVLSLFNNDINHYVSKCNFYEYLLDIHNICSYRYYNYCNEKN